MRFAGYWAVAFCALSMASGAQEHAMHSQHSPNADTSVQGKVVAAEKSWNQAYKSGDAKTLDGLVDNDVVLVSDDGNAPKKAQFLAGLNAPNAQRPDVSFEMMQVHVHGDVAIAAGILRVKGMAKGAVYVRRESFVHTWVNQEDKWVCIAASATPITY